MEDNKFEYSFEIPYDITYTEADSDTAYKFWSSTDYTYTLTDTSNTTQAMFNFTCSCCGKKFKTLDPLQDLCEDCLLELADFGTGLD